MKERLFAAIGEVGDDLIAMAETKTFVIPWKKWVSLAACLVLIGSFSVLALPHFTKGSDAEAAAGTPMMDAPAEAPMAAAPMEDFLYDVMEESKESSAVETDAEENVLHPVDEAQVAFAVEKGADDWLMNTFVQPLIDQGIRGFLDPTCLSSQRLNQFCLAMLQAEKSLAVGHELVMEPDAVEEVLNRHLQDYSYDPAETEEYDPETGNLVFDLTVQKESAGVWTLEKATFADGYLYLVVLPPEEEQDPNALCSERMLGIWIEGNDWYYEYFSPCG